MSHFSCPPLLFCPSCHLFLYLSVSQAEARLAAKRAARAEAREIRMKELERQQKEVRMKVDTLIHYNNKKNRNAFIYPTPGNKMNRQMIYITKTALKKNSLTIKKNIAARGAKLSSTVLNNWTSDCHKRISAVSLTVLGCSFATEKAHPVKIVLCS